MKNELMRKLDVKLKMLNCVLEGLTEEANCLKEARELQYKREDIYKTDTHKEAVKFTAYIEAIDDMMERIEMYIDGYQDVLCDNYDEDIRELEPEMVEQSNIQDDVFEEDFTCYPLDIEEDDDEDKMPF